MNKISYQNIESINNSNKYLEELINISKNFPLKNITYIEDNLYSFECFYKTKPTIAINCFKIPNHKDMDAYEKYWNKTLEEFLFYDFFKEYEEKGKLKKLEYFYKTMKHIVQENKTSEIKNTICNKTNSILDHKT